MHSSFCKAIWQPEVNDSVDDTKALHVTNTLQWNEAISIQPSNLVWQEECQGSWMKQESAATTFASDTQWHCWVPTVMYWMILCFWYQLEGQAAKYWSEYARGVTTQVLDGLQVQWLSWLYSQTSSLISGLCLTQTLHWLHSLSHALWERSAAEHLSERFQPCLILAESD